MEARYSLPSPLFFSDTSDFQSLKASPEGFSINEVIFPSSSDFKIPNPVASCAFTGIVAMVISPLFLQ